MGHVYEDTGQSAGRPAGAHTSALQGLEKLLVLGRWLPVTKIQLVAALDSSDIRLEKTSLPVCLDVQHQGLPEWVRGGVHLVLRAARQLSIFALLKYPVDLSRVGGKLHALQYSLVHSPRHRGSQRGIFVIAGVKAGESNCSAPEAAAQVLRNIVHPGCCRSQFCIFDCVHSLIPYTSYGTPRMRE